MKRNCLVKTGCCEPSIAGEKLECLKRGSSQDQLCPSTWSSRGIIPKRCFDVTARYESGVIAGCSPIKQDTDAEGLNPSLTSTS